MRPIKFRAWDKQAKKYIYPPNPLDSFLGDHFLTLDGRIYIDGVLQDIILEQFTGLFDKHGKAIYEGDILNWYTEKGTTNGLKMVVTYFDDRAMWGTTFGNGFDTFETYMEFGDVGKQFEIVGNIHEEK